MEIWKDIKGCQDYMVSNMGRVKSLKYGKEKILKGSLVSGYKRVYIANKKIFIHLLVAKAFIPNPENKPEIDHINTIRTDNRVENLRWVTRKENMNNPLTIQKKSGENNPKPCLGKYGKKHHNSKPILQLNTKGELIKIWDSMADIERDLGFNHSFISMGCNLKRKLAYGFKWRFYYKGIWQKNHIPQIEKAA